MNMTTQQFFERVAQLRKFQKAYFKNRDKESLQQSIALEKEIDAEIDRVQRILLKRQQTPNLFNQ